MTYRSTIQKVALPRELLPLLCNQAESCLHSCQVQNHIASVTILYQEKIHVSYFAFSFVPLVLPQFHSSISDCQKHIHISVLQERKKLENRIYVYLKFYIRIYTEEDSISTSKTTLSTSLGLSFLSHWSLVPPFGTCRLNVQ